MGQSLRWSAILNRWQQATGTYHQRVLIAWNTRPWSPLHFTGAGPRLRGASWSSITLTLPFKDLPLILIVLIWMTLGFCGSNNLKRTHLNCIKVECFTHETRSHKSTCQVIKGLSKDIVQGLTFQIPGCPPNRYVSGLPALILSIQWFFLRKHFPHPRCHWEKNRPVKLAQKDQCSNGNVGKAQSPDQFLFSAFESWSLMKSKQRVQVGSDSHRFRGAFDIWDLPP